MPSSLEFRTSWGAIQIAAASGKIVSCDMPFAGKVRSAFRPGKSKISALNSKDRTALKAADTFLRNLFRGRKAKTPPFAIPDAAPFMHEAWRQMIQIPAGKVITYRELARRAGSPKAFRAAGQACARNRIPILIPCHRVLAENNRLGGFSCGLAWKKLLLEIESLAR